MNFEQRDGTIWFDGEFIPWNDAKIHLITHGFHYASTVFEGIRAYGGKIFKLDEHNQRLKNSAEMLDFICLSRLMRSIKPARKFYNATISPMRICARLHGVALRRWEFPRKRPSPILRLPHGNGAIIFPISAKASR